MDPKFTVDYFINKLSRIPEHKWTTGKYANSADQFCALGHCGSRSSANSPAGDALYNMFAGNSVGMHQSIIGINDGNSPADLEFGDTPKERVLNALITLKALTEEA